MIEVLLGEGIQPKAMADSIQKRWAFLVGINEYDDPGYGNLQFCVDDVKTLGKLLATDLGYEVVSLHDHPSESRYKPTRSAIKQELKLLCDVVGPDDLLLVHFACHGIRVNNQPCLITSEVRSYNYDQDVLPVAEVESLMRSSGARCQVLLLDACHTGVEMGRDLADPEFIRHVYEQAEGFALIAASTAQQKAYEIDGHGVFTHYLLNALVGQADGYPGGIPKKGFVSVQDVQTYVLNNIKQWNQKTSQVQTPTARVEGFGDMIMAYYPEQVQTPLKASSPLDGTVGTVTARQLKAEAAQPQAISSTGIQVPKPLNLNQRNALIDALIDAFRSETKLNLMLSRELGIKLNSIVQNADTYEETVWKLVEEMEARGQTQKLMEGAIRRNPDNSRLKALSIEWQPG